MKENKGSDRDRRYEGRGATGVPPVEVKKAFYHYLPNYKFLKRDCDVCLMRCYRRDAYSSSGLVAMPCDVRPVAPLVWFFVQGDGPTPPIFCDIISDMAASAMKLKKADIGLFFMKTEDPMKSRSDHGMPVIVQTDRIMAFLQISLKFCKAALKCSAGLCLRMGLCHGPTPDKEEK